VTAGTARATAGWNKKWRQLDPGERKAGYLNMLGAGMDSMCMLMIQVSK